MNPLFISALVVLAIISTVSYYLGTKKNRWLVSLMSKQLEEALKPKTTNYVNIGGVIGYNFVYSLPAPYTSAKGTITLSPRHSILYLPVSKLLGISDRFFVNIFTKKKFKGEGHIVDAKYLGKANIAGLERMERKELVAKGKKFVLLWRKAELSSALENTLAALEDPTSLRHFCAYQETGTFFIHLRPKAGQLAETLQALVKSFPDYLESGKEQ